MYSYLKGVITELSINYIVIECNGIGYCVNFAAPTNFKLNEETLIYVYQQVKEDDLALFGFSTKEEKNFFLKLISVKGIGPKTALLALSSAPLEQIILAIENEDIAFLKCLPQIGAKAGQQIILDLKGKLVISDDKKTVKSTKSVELAQALKNLGFKASEINTVTNKIGNIEANSLEVSIKDALKLLTKV